MIVLIKENTFRCTASRYFDCVKEEKAFNIIYIRYFFHATTDRKLDKDYNVDVEEAHETVDASATPAVADKESPQVTSPTNRGVSPQTPREMDPIMADWFKIDKPQDGNALQKAQEDSETETDPDSDNDDVRFDEETEEWVLSEKPASSGMDPVNSAPSVSSSLLV